MLFRSAGLLYQEIQQLDEIWLDASQERLTEATLLTELERSVGYDGFIHHFKNYVLRRDPSYLEVASDGHERAMALVDDLAETELGREHPQRTDDLKKTLREYGRALTTAYQPQSADMTPSELDELVRVSDSAAAEALAHLRKAAGNISRDVKIGRAHV